MKFDTPASRNPIDRLKVVGQPTERIDGPFKTTGTATYAYEQHQAAPGAAYGYIVGAAIAKGRIEAIDLQQRKPRRACSASSRPTMPANSAPAPSTWRRRWPGRSVDHYHQAVAIVVAETFEQARAAAALVRVRYARAKGSFDLAEAKKQGAKQQSQQPLQPNPALDTAVGDFDAAYAAAPVTLDATYTTPDHGHAMMEPHATIAAWDGRPKLTLWTAIQIVSWGRRDLAKTLGIPKENIRIVSPYIGGGFGGKGSILSDAVLAAVAAKQLGRPVKVTCSAPSCSTIRRTVPPPSSASASAPARMGASPRSATKAGPATWATGPKPPPRRPSCCMPAPTA
jgi:xanthine dehydrogenase YagR molybdenum-binding subunit